MFFWSPFFASSFHCKKDVFPVSGAVDLFWGTVGQMGPSFGQHDGKLDEVENPNLAVGWYGILLIFLMLIRINMWKDVNHFKKQMCCNEIASCATLWHWFEGNCQSLSSRPLDCQFEPASCLVSQHGVFTWTTFRNHKHVQLEAWGTPEPYDDGTRDPCDPGDMKRTIKSLRKATVLKETQILFKATSSLFLVFTFWKGYSRRNGSISSTTQLTSVIGWSLDLRWRRHFRENLNVVWRSSGPFAKQRAKDVCGWIWYCIHIYIYVFYRLSRNSGISSWPFIHAIRM